MVYEIVEIDKKTIEVVGKTVESLAIKDVLIVQLPHPINFTEALSFVAKIKESLPEKTVVITDNRVKFCKLKRKKVKK